MGQLFIGGDTLGNSGVVTLSSKLRLPFHGGFFNLKVAKTKLSQLGMRLNLTYLLLINEISDSFFCSSLLKKFKRWSGNISDGMRYHSWCWAGMESANRCGFVRRMFRLGWNKVFLLGSFSRKKNRLL
jgi:hypothetical protein